MPILALLRSSLSASSLRWRAAAFLLLAATASTSRALIKFNDGRDELFVSASAGVSYDSNIFASPDGSEDTTYNASLKIEYHRKAGMLGVDASVGWDFAKFSEFTDEDFANPNFDVRLSKSGGRTTGSLEAGAKKENRADSAINLRTESWDYHTILDVKYPVIERYSVSGEAGYEKRDYSDNAVLVDIDTYSASANLLYALNSERDLVGSYRFRTTDTTADTTDQDHRVSVGVSGKIIPKVTGGANVGLQRRTIDKALGPDSSHSSWTAGVNANWTLSSRVGLFGALTKDFSTLATDESADTTSASLLCQYAMNSKATVYAGVAYGHLRFLDSRLGARTDDNVGLNAGASYTFNERLRFTATYGWFENWSTLPTSDFKRHSLSLSVSTRW